MTTDPTSAAFAHSGLTGRRADCKLNWGKVDERWWLVRDTDGWFIGTVNINESWINSPLWDALLLTAGAEAVAALSAARADAEQMRREHATEIEQLRTVIDTVAAENSKLHRLGTDAYLREALLDMEHWAKERERERDEWHAAYDGALAERDETRRERDAAAPPVPWRGPVRVEAFGPNKRGHDFFLRDADGNYLDIGEKEVLDAIAAALNRGAGHVCGLPAVAGSEERDDG